MDKKNIITGSDHAGFVLKERLKPYIESLGFKVKDIGVYSEESADYPAIAKAAAKEAVLENCYALLICGTGIGMSIAANKIKGARAALCGDVLSAEFSRKHNDANILCLGARIITPEKAEEICRIWLGTEFEGGRHKRRIDMIESE